MYSTLTLDHQSIKNLGNSPEKCKPSFSCFTNQSSAEKTNSAQNTIHTVEGSKKKRIQVKNACVNCQKACKKCDDGRPCQRCIKYDLVETCRNSVRKTRKSGVKRGPYKRKSIETKKIISAGPISGHPISVSGEETINEKQTMMAQLPHWQGDIPNIYSYESYTTFKNEPNVTSSISSSMLIPDGNRPELGVVYPLYSSKSQSNLTPQSDLAQLLSNSLVGIQQNYQTKKDDTLDLKNTTVSKQNQELYKSNEQLLAITKRYNNGDYFSFKASAGESCNDPLYFLLK